MIHWTVKDVDERMQKALKGERGEASSAKLLEQLKARAGQSNIEQPKE